VRTSSSQHKADAVTIIFRAVAHVCEFVTEGVTVGPVVMPFLPNKPRGVPRVE
jgi:hypothetical protein